MIANVRGRNRTPNEFDSCPVFFIIKYNSVAELGLYLLVGSGSGHTVHMNSRRLRPLAEYFFVLSLKSLIIIVASASHKDKKDRLRLRNASLPCGKLFPVQLYGHVL